MRGAKGLSANEILVVLAIIAVALVAIASMFPTAYSNVDRAGYMVRDFLPVNVQNWREVPLS